MLVLDYFTIHYIVYKSLSLSSFSTLRYKCVTNISWVLTSTSCGSHFCIVVLYLHRLDVTVLKGRARQDFASIIGFYLLYWLASHSMYRIRDAYARVSPKANLSSKRYNKFSCIPVFTGNKAVCEDSEGRSWYWLLVIYLLCVHFLLLIISSFILNIFISHMAIAKKLGCYFSHFYHANCNFLFQAVMIIAINDCSPVQK